MSVFSQRAAIKSSSPPRFDLVMKEVRQDSVNKKYRGLSNVCVYEKTDLFKSRMITEKPQSRAFSQINKEGVFTNSKALKQNFLMGDKGAVLYGDKKETTPSTY